MKLSRVLRISRPHFWAYEAATFVFFGAYLAAPGISMFANINFWVFLIYFILPANILIYGINDIFDYETDRHNPKKVEYEGLVEPGDRKALYTYIAVTNLPFVLYVLYAQLPLAALTSLFLFLFFASFYSAPPVRAKAIPFMDSLFSAGHYTVTGVFGFFLLGGQNLQMQYVLAGMCWCVAMHAFSAVPDIIADKKANLDTIATKLGRSRTITLCMFLYGLAGALIYPVVILAPVLSVVYIALLFYCKIQRSEQKLLSIYTYFSYINVCSGGVIALSLIFPNM